MIAYVPFRPAGRLDYRRHAISVQAFGLGEVHHIENDPLEKKKEKNIKKKRNTYIIL